MSEEPQLATTPARPHPEAIGKRWGDPISKERQAELQGILDAWEALGADHGERRGPFDREPGQLGGARLTGADVSWLTRRSERDLHLEGAFLRYVHLETLYVNSCAGTRQGDSKFREG